MFKKLPMIILMILLTVATCNLNRDANQQFPKIESYKTGYLKVSGLHDIFYQLGGNPDGKPVMVLHGGPGAGCDPGFFRYFDPEKFHIILHDQRGCGRSKPYAELKQNTTQNLVEDIEKLRQHLKLGKVILFGGLGGRVRNRVRR